MERDTAVGVGAFGTILQIALDRRPHLGQLAAYLVVTPRFQIHLEQRIAVAVSQHTIVEHRPFGPRPLPVIGHRLVALLVAHQVVHQFAALLLGGMLHDSPILLFHLAVAEHLVQPGQCLARFGKDHHTAHGAVEAMSYPHEDIARLVVLLLEPSLQLLAQRHVARLVALHDFGAGLVDDNHMIVFVEYLHSYPVLFPAQR